VSDRRALLFSQMTPPEGQTEEFHDWYEREHVPARMNVAGFTRATRWAVVDGSPQFLACYELDNLAVLSTPEYRRVKEQPSPRTDLMLRTVAAFTRYTLTLSSAAGKEDGDAMQAVAFNVPDEHASEFDDWYESEHIPLLMSEPRWHGVTRWKTTGTFDGPSWTHLALHYLDDLDVLDSPARETARTTAWRAELAEHPWFAENGRWVYRRISIAIPQLHGGL
jgi:hypothetical protein